MRIELRNESRQRMGRIDVDPTQRPTRVTVSATLATQNVERRKARLQSLLRRLASFATGRPTGNPKIHSVDESHFESGPSNREVFLNWDTAVDDAGQLRRCVACGCPDMFTEKAFPVVTGFIVVLAFIGAIVGALGLATNLPVLLTMAGVLALDVAILVFSRRRLGCYRCRTTYYDLPIARHHRAWDRSAADRYPAPAVSTASKTDPSVSGTSGDSKDVVATSATTAGAGVSEGPAAAHKGYFA